MIIIIIIIQSLLSCRSRAGVKNNGKNVVNVRRATRFSAVIARAPLAQGRPRKISVRARRKSAHRRPHRHGDDDNGGSSTAAAFACTYASVDIYYMARDLRHVKYTQRRATRRLGGILTWARHNNIIRHTLTQGIARQPPLLPTPKPPNRPTRPPDIYVVCDFVMTCYYYYTVFTLPWGRGQSVQSENRPFKVPCDWWATGKRRDF